MLKSILKLIKKVLDFGKLTSMRWLLKTVLKQLLSKYGILSVEMQNMTNALTSDGAVIRDNDGELTPDFEGETIDVQSDVAETIANNANSETIDIEPTPTSEFVDPETGEVVHMFGD